MNKKAQLNIMSIKEHQKIKLGEYLHLPWIFDKWYEKVILCILSWLGAWKIITFVWELI